MRWRERAAVATSGASAQQPFISNVSVRTLHHQVASENRAWCFLPRRGAARVFKSWSALPFDGERRGKARRGQVQCANSPMSAPNMPRKQSVGARAGVRAVVAQTSKEELCLQRRGLVPHSGGHCECRASSSRSPKRAGGEEEPVLREEGAPDIRWAHRQRALVLPFGGDDDAFGGGKASCRTCGESMAARTRLGKWGQTNASNNASVRAWQGLIRIYACQTVNTSVLTGITVVK